MLPPRKVDTPSVSFSSTPKVLAAAISIGFVIPFEIIFIGNVNVSFTAFTCSAFNAAFAAALAASFSRPVLLRFFMIRLYVVIRPTKGTTPPVQLAVPASVKRPNAPEPVVKLNPRFILSSSGSCRPSA